MLKTTAYTDRFQQTATMDNTPAMEPVPALPAATRLIDSLQYWQQHAPDKPALWWQDEYISYAELYETVSHMAEAFSGYSQAGARIAVLAYNSAQYIALLYAIPAAARVIVPLNARLAPSELSYQLQQSGAELLIADKDLLQTLQTHETFQKNLSSSLMVIETGEDLHSWVHDQTDKYLSNQSQHDIEAMHSDPDQLAWLLYTSGSTGRPKAAMLSQSGLLAALDSGAYGRPVLLDDSYLYPFPLFHVAAHNILLQHRFGACVVLLKSFDAATVIRLCRKLSIDTLSLAPTMIAMLLDHPDFCFDDIAKVRTIGYGASAIPAALLQRLLDNSSVGLCQGYGMTELSGSIAFLDAESHRQALSSHPQRLKSLGKIVPGVELRITHDGEIAVRAKQTMLGYWQQDEATLANLVDGWLLTGDMGYFDDDGYLYLTDRKKDMIITGGENVASREVEDILTQVPGIKQSAIVATTDSRWGEAVTAYIQLSEPGMCSEEDIEQHCRAHLAGYKVPKYIYFVTSLPINANGKINKPALRLDAEKRAKLG